VGLAPPRIASCARDGTGASQACELEDEDLEDEPRAAQQAQQQQQQHAQTCSVPQQGSSGPVQSFTGSKATGRRPLAPLPAAPARQLPDIRACALAACNGAAVQAHQAAGTLSSQFPHCAAGNAVPSAPAATAEQGIVVEGSLNDGQKTAVRRCASLAPDEPCFLAHQATGMNMGRSATRLILRSACLQDTDRAGLRSRAGHAWHWQDGCHLCRSAQPAGRQEDCARHIVHQQVLKHVEMYLVSTLVYEPRVQTLGTVASTLQNGASGHVLKQISWVHSAVDNILLRLRAESLPVLRLGRIDSVHPSLHDCLPGGRLWPDTSVAKLRSLARCAGVVRIYCLGPPPCSPSNHGDACIRSYVDVSTWLQVGATALGMNSPLLLRHVFDVVIVDEAGQMTLPSTIAPLLKARAFVLVRIEFQEAECMTHVS
jgi:hypothetical protein